MKIGMKLLQSTLLFSLILVFTSCGTSNEVVNGGIFSKRKYNKGYHLSLKKDFKTTSEKEELAKINANLDKKEEVVIASNSSNDKIDIETSIVVQKESTKDDNESTIQPITLESLKSDKHSKKSVLHSLNDVKQVKNSIKSIAKEKTLSKMKPAGRSSNGSMSNLLYCLLLVLIILAILYYLPGFIGTILMIVIALLIVFFLLRFFGFM
jgi:hypothetical protein